MEQEENKSSAFEGMYEREHHPDALKYFKDILKKIFSVISTPFKGK